MSLIGNDARNTAWSPVSLRSSGSTSYWRKASNDSRWTASRLGTSMISWNRPRLTRFAALLLTNMVPPGKARSGRRFGSLDFDRRSAVRELGLDGLGLFRRHAFLDRLGRPVDEIL